MGHMRTADSVLHDALALDLSSREWLIRRLIESLDDSPAEADAEEAWAEVIERRVADLDAGRATVIDGKQAIAQARAELARKRRG